MSSAATSSRALLAGGGAEITLFCPSGPSMVSALHMTAAAVDVYPLPVILRHMFQRWLQVCIREGAKSGRQTHLLSQTQNEPGPLRKPQAGKLCTAISFFFSPGPEFVYKNGRQCLSNLTAKQLTAYQLNRITRTKLHVP